MANYPESRDFVETVSLRRLPGSQTLLEGCLTTSGDQGPGTSTTTPRDRHQFLGCYPCPMKSLDVKGLHRMNCPERLALTIAQQAALLPTKRIVGCDSVAIQEHPKVEYRGTPGPQMAMSEVIERYSPRPASALKGTDNSAPSSSSSTARAAKTVPAYYPPFDKVSGIVVTRDANRIWQVAPRLNDKQFRDRQRAPLSSADQAQLRKLSIIANLSRTLRAFDTGICEKAWVQRVIRRLTTAHNNCLRPMQNNLNEQISARYSLQAGETRETHSTFPRNLEALKPIPKNLIQRTRYCVMIDSTVPCDLP